MNTAQCYAAVMEPEMPPAGPVPLLLCERVPGKGDDLNIINAPTWYQSAIDGRDWTSVVVTGEGWLGYSLAFYIRSWDPNEARKLAAKAFSEWDKARVVWPTKPRNKASETRLRKSLSANLRTYAALQDGLYRRYFQAVPAGWEGSAGKGR